MSPQSSTVGVAGGRVRTGDHPSARVKPEREALLPELVKFVTANPQIRAKTQVSSLPAFMLPCRRGSEHALPALICDKDAAGIVDE